MSTKETAALVKLGKLVVDHFIAQVNAKIAKRAYWDKLSEYECEIAEIKGKLDRFADEHADVRAYTAIEFAAYADAKRHAYNIKRRIETACRAIPKF